MKKYLLTLILLIPIFCFAQSTSKYYKLATARNKSLSVASATDGGLAFKVNSDEKFEIAAGDVMSITLENGEVIAIECDKPSSYHAQHSVSGGYYNAAFFKVSKAVSEQLKQANVAEVKFAGLTFVGVQKPILQKVL